ncbi:MAG: glycoside hydrolase family 2 protein [Armatimonadetes bacterium]|nr:glycoside hydrolase family 2 protein [Armatimonadota bacterium]
MDVLTRDLHSGWEFATADYGRVRSPDDLAGREFRPATVPGTNLTDLQAAGLVEPETSATYEQSFAVHKRADFIYRLAFEGGEEARKRRVFLCFDGLDTLCDIFLNGEKIGAGEDAYLRYRFDVSGKLRPGRNELVVIFRSPVLGAAGLQRAHQVKFPMRLDAEFMHIRKPAYSFFWDWGPEVPVSGIYRPVYLKAHDRAEIKDFHVRYRVDGQHVSGTVRVTAPGADGAVAVVAVAGRRQACRVCEGVATALFDIPSARLWFPNGEGDPFLYDMEITLEDGAVLDRKRHRIGFRTVEIVRDDRTDRPGRRFRFRVNGKDLFIRGYNWIPVDSSIPRGYYDRYRRNLDLARESHVNMLRVWGGGYYEDDEFYRLCDERGIMVWQDGMFTCSMYPEAESFLKLVEAELTDNIRRLRNHTSLALWCGENECHWGWEEWWVDLRSQFEHFPGGAIFDTLFRALAADLDPDRFYWNGSPYSGEPGVAANDPHFGDTHLWDLHTNCEDLSRYHRTRPGFVSETGIQSLPDLRTALTIGTAEDHDIQSFLFDTRNHYESPAKNDRLLKFVAALFRVPADFARAVILTNLAHAEYLKCAVEHWRSQAPNCGGVLIWQLNDCWPAISWSAVDYNLIPKACHYAMKRAFQPDLVGFRQESSLDYNALADSRGELFVASERDGAKSGTVAMRVVRVTGEEVAREGFAVVMEGRGAVSLGEVTLPNYQACRFDCVVEFVLRWEGGGGARNVYTFSRPKHMRLPPPQFVLTQVSPDSLTVRSGVFAKGVYLFHADRSVVFSDNYFDLMPGEERVIHASREVAVEQVQAYPYHH